MEKTYLQQVGERVQKSRNNNFISRKELAIKADVTINDIRCIERGEIEIGIETAVKICKGLGYSTDYILTGDCGLDEFLKMNQKLCNLPSVNYKNLEKVATAFWQTCPRFFR